MSEVNDRPLPRPKVQLIGEDGNAFNVLARCRRAARTAEWTYDDWVYFHAEATSGDCAHLLATVLRHFHVE